MDGWMVWCGESGKKKKHANLVIVSVLGRSEGDSNSRTAFDGYTLSRRASSATRASLLVVCECKDSVFYLIFAKNR